MCRGVLLVLPFLVLCVTAAGLHAAPEPVGKVDSLSGKARVVREGKTLAAAVGDPVFLGDRWQTQPDSALEILFLDNSRVKLAPSTVLEITEYLYNPGEKTRQGLLSMVSGKARFLVQDLQDFKDKRFRVQTQTSVVGTRDTDFIVRVKSEREHDEACREALSEALCVENAITVYNRKAPEQSVILTANMISQVCGDNLPSTPRFVTAAELQRLLRGVEQIGQKKELSRAATIKAGGGGETQSATTAPEAGTEMGSSGITIEPGGVPVSLNVPPGTGVVPGGSSGTEGGISLPPPNTKPEPVYHSLPPPPPPPLPDR